ncbi:aromatic acid exporter family protein [Metabacillus litoralis]|uniref:Aromatic acid exporter family protein n=1 Tax=Metabacillus litoralis TaxID=152268 RepID=A0A5C6VXI8_9BACI|nr:aromatic acid exporter family protein [Metabacillus litoralis]
MTFGPRILKTGLAVSLSIYICSLFNFELAVFAGVAAILAIQPSIYRTWKQMVDQIIANTIGATISLFFIYFFGENPVIIGFVIIIVISISLKLNMQSTIPLTLVTVLAVMSAAGSEDLYFALERFYVILIGTFTAILVNLLILPPRYKKSFIQSVEKTFQNMSLLIRTAISNELTEATYQEHSKTFKKDIKKLEDQFLLFDEERAKLGRKANQLHAREILVFRQLFKTLQEGAQLLENIEDHFFQSNKIEEEAEFFDDQLEHLIKYHEFLLLKYQGKIKENHSGFDQEDFKESYELKLKLYLQNTDQNVRLLIVASSIIDYSFHLKRLDKLISQLNNQ